MQVLNFNIHLGISQDFHISHKILNRTITFNLLRTRTINVFVVVMTIRAAPWSQRHFGSPFICSRLSTQDTGTVVYWLYSRSDDRQDNIAASHFICRLQSFIRFVAGWVWQTVICERGCSGSSVPRSRYPGPASTTPGMSPQTWGTQRACLTTLRMIYFKTFDPVSNFSLEDPDCVYDRYCITGTMETGTAHISYLSRPYFSYNTPSVYGYSKWVAVEHLLVVTRLSRERAGAVGVTQ